MSEDETYCDDFLNKFDDWYLPEDKEENKPIGILFTADGSDHADKTDIEHVLDGNIQLNDDYAGDIIFTPTTFVNPLEDLEKGIAALEEENLMLKERLEKLEAAQKRRDHYDILRYGDIGKTILEKNKAIITATQKIADDVAPQLGGELDFKIQKTRPTGGTIEWNMDVIDDVIEDEKDAYKRAMKVL